MCCIVLKTYYLCDVIGINRLISSHKVLKSIACFDSIFASSLSCRRGEVGEVKSTAMKKLFQKRTSLRGGF